MYSGARTQAQTPPPANGLRFQTSCYGKPIPVVWGQARIAGNLIWYGDFNVLTVTQPSAGGGKGGPFGGGGKGGGGTSSYQYYAAIELGLCQGGASAGIDGVGTVWFNKQQTTLAALGMSLYTGTSTQTPWPYLTTNHPGQDLGYRREAYVAASGYRLTDVAEVPQHSFEIQGLRRFNVGGGIVDAHPADILTDGLTDSIFGASPGFTLASMVGDGGYQNYCTANGIFLSPELDAQIAAREFVTRLMQLTNSDVAWVDGGVGGALAVFPYGDQAITGNGVTFTPNLTPQYDLGDDDYLGASASEPPVKLTRTSPADAYNQVQVQFLDRSDQYAQSVAEAKDQPAIDNYGLRPMSTVDGSWIKQMAIASFVATLILNRQLYVRNEFKFRLPVKYMRLEAGDLVTLTDSNLGLNRQLVRLTKVTYARYDDLSIECEAEEVPVGAASSPAYGAQAGQGAQADYNVAPGNTVAGPIFEAPGYLTANGFEVWIPCAGGVNWGGCEVWASTDNSKFTYQGKLQGPSRFGVLTAPLASSLDPDTTDTCSVDLTSSRGALSSGTQADCDALNTRCLVDSEVISYQTATLTAQYKYNLTTRLRRGAYNTSIAAHSTNAPFVRLDNNVFRLPYDQKLIGSTIYIKLPAFNVYGNAKQDQSTLTSIAYTLVGPLGAPDNVTGFAVSQNGQVAVFQWNLLPAANISGYEIRYNPANALDPTNWGNATPLTQVTKGTQITTAKLPPGSWTCLVKAVDTSQKYSLKPASFNFTMQNANTIIQSARQDPDYLGTAVGYVRHPAGYLMPESTKQANQLTNAQLFQSFVPFPVSFCQYDSPEIDLGFDSTVRIHGDVTSRLGPGVSTGVASPALLMASRLSGGVYAGYQAWTVGNATCRYFKMRITEQPIAVGNAEVSAFNPTADNPIMATTLNAVTIAAGGTTVTFPSQYHIVPSVTATVVGTSGLTAVVSSITTTSCVVHVFNTSNTDVGGTVNLIISGV